MKIKKIILSLSTITGAVLALSACEENENIIKDKNEVIDVTNENDNNNNQNVNNDTLKEGNETNNDLVDNQGNNDIVNDNETQLNDESKDENKDQTDSTDTNLNDGESKDENKDKDDSNDNNDNKDETDTTENNNEDTNSTVRKKPENLANSTLYVVGDSTVDSFLNSDGSIKDSTYFYQRCGWGGHIADFATDKLTVKNYGSSGKSSKDYMTSSASKPYYDDIKANIKAGDYLMIGFGHNDEKYDDSTRYTDATKPVDDPTSFKYSLYENYIKVAIDRGATPILCTPIVRYDSTNQYTGNKVHDLGTYGDYAEAIRELGKEKDVLVIDLTTYTKELFQTATPSEAIYYMSLTGGISATEPNLSTTDGTHINNYCAKVIDYYIANVLYNNNDAYLGNYIIDERIEPTKGNDLSINPNYKYTPYSAPNLSQYSAPSNFTTIANSGWYGTGFGDCGGDPATSSNGYVAKQLTENSFEVGVTTNKGKIASTSEGFAFMFKQVSKNDNFEISATATVKSLLENYQAGFGLTIRDAAWIKESSDTVLKDASLISNHASAAILTQGSKTTIDSVLINYWRENTTKYETSKVSSIAYKANDTAEFKIKRVGQQITLTTTYNNVTTVSEMKTDFDVLAKDSEYMYVGMFAAKGTLVTFTNVNYTYLGNYEGA